MASAPPPFVVLVTGANSGIGFATCCRLIDEFLYTRDPSHRLKIIVTTRSADKGHATIARLEAHAAQWSKKFIRIAPSGLFSSKSSASDSLSNPDHDDKARVTFESEQLELTNLVSIRDCANRLRFTNTRIDALILNAGISGIIGIDYRRALWRILTDTTQAVTWPDFNLQLHGGVAAPQTLRGKNKEDAYQPPLGKIFTANLFGHYMLAHGVMPLLWRASGEPSARIVWVSSIDTFPEAVQLDDMQGLKSKVPYEGVKRVIDIMTLTSSLDATQKPVMRFLSHPSTPTERTTKPSMYLTHPGCVCTDIGGVTNPVQYFFYWLMFYVARLLGSPWHTTSPYAGAAAAVWIAIAEQGMLENLEGKRGKGKWGSSTNWYGDERVVKTEVDGWGLGGRVEPEGTKKGKRLARRRGALDVTVESRKEFEEDGVRVWTELERLREEWEDLIGE